MCSQHEETAILLARKGEFEGADVQRSHRGLESEEMARDWDTARG